MEWSAYMESRVQVDPELRCSCCGSGGSILMKSRYELEDVDPCPICLKCLERIFARITERALKQSGPSQSPRQSETRHSSDTESPPPPPTWTSHTSDTVYRSVEDGPQRIEPLRMPLLTFEEACAMSKGQLTSGDDATMQLSARQINTMLPSLALQPRWQNTLSFPGPDYGPVKCPESLRGSAPEEAPGPSAYVSRRLTEWIESCQQQDPDGESDEEDMEIETQSSKPDSTDQLRISSILN